MPLFLPLELHFCSTGVNVVRVTVNLATRRWPFWDLLQPTQSLVTPGTALNIELVGHVGSPVGHPEHLG